MEEKSKIEKLVFAGDLIENELERIRIKLNEIIDYLNIQPQTEEKVCNDCSGSNIGKKFHESDFDMRFKKGHKLAGIDTCLDCGSDDIKKIGTQDTPEQKEDWEERFAEFFLYVTNDKNWVDGRPEWKGDVFVTLYNAILHFIEKLLDEREREAEKNLLKRFYNVTSKEEFRDMLDKLLNKKK